MAVYISGLLLTQFLLMTTQFFKPKKKYVSIGNNFRFRVPELMKIMPMFPLMIIAGIRYNVGYDYNQTYVYIFKKVMSGYSSEVWGDFGYIMLNKLVGKFTDDYAGIFIVTAIIFCPCIFVSLYRESKNVAMSAFLFVCTGFYFNYLNGMRQMLALAILMLSIKFVKERSFWKFGILVSIACVFHLSALVFVSVYFLYNIKLNNYKRILFVVAVYLGARGIALIAQKLIMYTKYSWYFTDDYSSLREGYVATIMCIGIFLLACIFSRREEDALFINMQMIAVCVQAFIGLIPQVNRIGWYYGFSSIFLIPNVIESMSNKKTAQLIRIGVYILYFIYFIYTVAIKNSNSVLPYQTIFSR